MLAGKLPWQVALRGEGDVGETLLRDFAQAQKQKETEKGRTVPDEILSLIGDVLSRDPARRPADAGELLELVRRLPKPGLSAAAPSEKNSTAASAGGRSKLERRAAEPTPPAAAPPAAAESSSPGTHSVSGTETPPMGVEVLTELLKKIKEQEPHVAAPPPAPPSRSSLRVMLAVFALFAALGLLGVGGLLFLRTRGAGTLPPALVALLRQPKPAPPGDSGPAPPSPAPASRPADLSPGARTAVSQTMAAPPPPDLAQSPPRTADLGVAADAGTEHKGAPGAEDPKAIKLRFVYGEEDGVDSIDCTDEAEVLKRGEDKHGTFVEVLLKPGGSCRASGPGGGKNYKYETLSQKHIDNAGFRRVHVRLSQSGQEEAATAAKPTTDGKPASPLPPPPSPDKDKAKEKEGGGS